MAAKTTGYANSLLSLIFNGTTFSGLARNDTAPVTNFYFSLHSSALNASSDQSTNEISYTGYTRTACARSALGFTITANSCSPVSPILFPQCTGGSATATYFGLGTSSSGSGQLLYWGPISPSLSISNLITPELLATSAFTEV